MIVGIDYSITSPCICVLGPTFQETVFHFLTDKKKLGGSFENIIGWLHKGYETTEERFFNITNWVMSCLPVNLEIILEDYALGAKGQTFSIGENTGLLKHYLYKSNIKFRLVAPTTIKKFATGKGNANKELMYDHFFKKTKVNLFDQLHLTNNSQKIGSPISDIVDSYYIALYGANLQFSK